MFTWDGIHRKRLSTIVKYDTSISAMDFSSDGQLLAMAVSYTFEHGDVDHPEDSVVIRVVHDKEVTPKVAK